VQQWKIMAEEKNKNELEIENNLDKEIKIVEK